MRDVGLGPLALRHSAPEAACRQPGQSLGRRYGWFAAKHLLLDIAEGRVSRRRDQASIDAGAAADGSYVIRTPVSAETPAAAVAACKGLPAWNGLPPHQGRRPGPAAPSGTGPEPADAAAARKADPGNQPIRGLRDLVDHLAILTRETMPIAGQAIDKLTIVTPASSAPSTSPAPRSRSACPPRRRHKTTRNHNPQSTAGSATSADVPSA
jgi:hypothetical protein